METAHRALESISQVFRYAVATGRAESNPARDLKDATARTLLHEHLGFDPDVIEAQLAHSVRDSLGRAYNRTEFIAQRRKMLQTQADHLDALRGGAALRNGSDGGAMTTQLLPWA
ncbi:phage integrase central domain-containing protein [Methylibium rhizosphaerae]|uniref:phage integrase central domain-containing protein n=1 Tax=Methylibium rhizosphaerae TaxID=2570323 RepID=UPI003CCC4A74